MYKLQKRILVTTPDTHITFLYNLNILQVIV